MTAGTATIDLTPRPLPGQLFRHGLNTAIPMVGFGMMDNFIMIQAGDFIDSTLGVKFGLTTLTAAACGQICSDFSGVCFGGFIDALAAKLGLPRSGLTTKQFELSVVKKVGVCGAAIGVVLGCCIGMTCLLFMDLEKADRLKKQAELNTLFGSIMDHGHQLMNAQHCTLWLLLEADNKGDIWVHTRAKSGCGSTERALQDAFHTWDLDNDGRLQLEELKRGLEKMDRMKTEAQIAALIAAQNPKVSGQLDSDEFKRMMQDTILVEDVVLPLAPNGIKGKVLETKETLNIPDVRNSKLRSQTFDQRNKYAGFQTISMLVAPIIDSAGVVIGMVEMVNKMAPDGKTTAFDKNDEKLVEMLAVHAALFIESASC